MAARSDDDFWVERGAVGGEPQVFRSKFQGGWFPGAAKAVRRFPGPCNPSRIIVVGRVPPRGDSRSTPRGGTRPTGEELNGELPRGPLPWGLAKWVGAVRLPPISA